MPKTTWWNYKKSGIWVDPPPCFLKIPTFYRFFSANVPYRTVMSSSFLPIKTGSSSSSCKERIVLSLLAILLSMLITLELTITQWHTFWHFFKTFWYLPHSWTWSWWWSPTQREAMWQTRQKGAWQRGRNKCQEYLRKYLHEKLSFQSFLFCW